MYQTIHEAAAAIRQGSATPIDLVEQCLSAIDQWEPKVKAWVFVDRDQARTEAKRLTDELQQGKTRGPLHGIPIGVKDIFDVFDWPTACGSTLWANSVARADAPVIQGLRAAGCIFLGKTVTTQYASFDPPVTLNPWNLARTPGGSSSGSAAAVATGMCLGALGSQTGGSITRPASYCGIWGCKPSYGRFCLEGIMPLAHSMDHPGPMGRCVEDLRLLLEAMTPAKDLPGNVGMPPKLTEADASKPKPRFGLVGGLFAAKADQAVRAMMQVVSARLIQQGALVKEQTLPPLFAEVTPRHRMVMAVEAAQFHETRLRRHPDDYRPRIRELVEEGLACSGPEYARSKQHQANLKEDMVGCLQGFDALLTPATTCAAPAAQTTGNPEFNSPWSYTGLPTVSLPTGQFVDGLPLCIQLVGGHCRDGELLQTAAWCEKALGSKPLTPPLPA